LNIWKSELTPSMLADGLYREIAEEIGVENLLKLSRIIGGATFYLPREDRLLLPLRDKKILDEYNGYNTLELAQRYEVSQRWVRQIVAKNQLKQGEEISK